MNNRFLTLTLLQGVLVLQLLIVGFAVFNLLQPDAAAFHTLALSVSEKAASLSKLLL